MVRLDEATTNDSALCARACLEALVFSFFFSFFFFFLFFLLGLGKTGMLPRVDREMSRKCECWITIFTVALGQLANSEVGPWGNCVVYQHVIRSANPLGQRFACGSQGTRGVLKKLCACLSHLRDRRMPDLQPRRNASTTALQLGSAPTLQHVCNPFPDPLPCL
jgi:hypothetical protein